MVKMSLDGVGGDALNKHCLKSEKKVHSDFDFFTFYLIKCVNWVLPGVDPGN